MTDCELLQMLADGNTVSEISEKTDTNRRTLEKRIEILKKRSDAENTTHLVVKYFRLGLVN